MIVCVAGNLRERMIFNMSEDEFDSVIAVHLKGHFNLYRHASAVMRKQDCGGSLVGFASAAFVGSTAQANYSAAKGGIISLTRSAALSLHRYGIRANCIAPVAKTRMSDQVPFEIESGMQMEGNFSASISANYFSCKPEANANRTSLSVRCVFKRGRDRRFRL